VNQPKPAYPLGEPVKDSALLKSLAPDRVIDVPLKYLSIEEGFNVRDFTSAENKDHIKRLAVLIGVSGVETPVHVRAVGDRIVITDGECRVRASVIAAEAGSKEVATIPARLDPHGEDEAYRTESLVVKNTGRPLAMLETLEVIKRLRAFGRTQSDVQAALGFTRTHMSNLNLLDLATPPVREYIRLGKVAPTTVVDLIRDYKDEPEIVEQAVAKAVQRVEKQEAKGAGGAAADGRVTKKTLDPADGVVYTRTTFDGLIRVHQRLLADMTPAQNFRKWRNWIRQALENVGAPLELEDEEVSV
jgi:ParB-like chromosome segregation protein Spo0J